MGERKGSTCERCGAPVTRHGRNGRRAHQATGDCASAVTYRTASQLGLVRVHVDAWEGELARAGVPVERLPVSATKPKRGRALGAGISTAPFAPRWAVRVLDSTELALDVRRRALALLALDTEARDAFLACVEVDAGDGGAARALLAGLLGLVEPGAGLVEALSPDGGRP